MADGEPKYPRTVADGEAEAKADKYAAEHGLDDIPDVQEELGGVAIVRAEDRPAEIGSLDIGGQEIKVVDKRTVTPQRVEAEFQEEQAIRRAEEEANEERLKQPLEKSEQRQIALLLQADFLDQQDALHDLHSNGEEWAEEDAAKTHELHEDASAAYRIKQLIDSRYFEQRGSTIDEFFADLEEPTQVQIDNNPDERIIELLRAKELWAMISDKEKAYELRRQLEERGANADIKAILGVDHRKYKAFIPRRTLRYTRPNDWAVEADELRFKRRRNQPQAMQAA